MDRYITLEEHQGRGRLWRDDQVVLADVPYAFRISQRMMEARTLRGSSEIPGLKSIEGWLTDDVPLMLIGEPVTLELQDGRLWQCFIQSSDGNLLNRGGLSQKEPP